MARLAFNPNLPKLGLERNVYSYECDEMFYLRQEGNAEYFPIKMQNCFIAFPDN